MAGCADTGAIWVSSEDAVALILVAIDALETTAQTILPDEGPVRIELGSDRERAVYLLEYEQRPASITTSGPLELVDPPSGTELPPPSRVLEADLHGGSLSEWTESFDLSPELARIRLATPSPCQEFDTVEVELPELEPSRLNAAIPLGGDRVLLGFEDGQLYEVDPAEANLVTATATVGGLRGLVAGARLGDEIWLVGVSGRTLRGSIDRGFVDGPAVPKDAFINRRAVLVTSPAGEPPELYLWTGQHWLLQLDGAQWRSLYTSTADAGFVRGLWLGPSELLLSSEANPGEVLHVKDGSVEREAFPNGSTARPFDLVRSESLGLVVGAELGQVFAKNGETWEELPRAEGIGKVQAIVAWQAGLLLGGDGGVTAQYDPTWGTCAADSYYPDDIIGLIPVEHGVFVQPRFEESEGLAPVFVFPRP